MPAPKSRFLQVSGQVGTLQAAIRHSLDIQGQCPCLLGIVPPSHHGNTHSLAAAAPVLLRWQIPKSIMCMMCHTAFT